MEGIAESLIGHKCEELVLEQYWHQQNLISPANVCWFRFEGSWYRLFLDAGSVHWTSSDGSPKPYDMPEYEAKVTLLSPVKESDFAGSVLTSYKVAVVDQGCEVELGFESGKFITLRNASDDNTTYRCTA